MNTAPQKSNRMPLDIVVNDVCSLRILKARDAPRIYDIVQANKDIKEECITWARGASSEQDIAKRIEEFTAHKALRYSIVVNDIVAGYVGAWHHDLDMANSDYEFGYFCDAAYRGQGLVSLSTKCLMDCVRENMQVDSFAMYIEDTNTASQAVATNLGFLSTDIVEKNNMFSSLEERRWEVNLCD